MTKTIYYFDSKPIFVPKKWELLRDLGRKELSHAAQLKLEWIIFYYTLGKKNATATARQFGLTRKTVHKWLTRFDERHLASLEEESRAPLTTREREITPEQRERIIELRKKHIRWGKMKLKRRYQKVYGEELSSWKFQVVIEEENLYYNRTEQRSQQQKRKQAQREQKKRITEFVKEHKIHHLWHVDTVVCETLHNTLVKTSSRFLIETALPH